MTMRKDIRAVAAGAAILAFTFPAGAACPIELATYRDTSGVAEIDFSPVILPEEGEPEISNSFRLLLDNDVVIEGQVKWEGREPRPMATLRYKCPEGEPTAEDLEACTVWNGVVYAVGETGDVGLLPQQGQAAPSKLLFPALGPSLRLSVAYGADGFSEAPEDVFALKGCQE